MKSILYFILFLFSICSLYSQKNLIEGIVISNNKQPLEYVNIGIKNKNIGTITNESGDFQLILENENLNDSLSFSYLGYKTLTIKIEDIFKTNKKEFILEEKILPLDEVILSSKKSKLKKLGTSSYVSFVAGYIRDDNKKNKNIQEFAKWLNIKKPSQILNINFNLFMVRLDTAVFRVNVYNVADGLPNENILNKNIILKQKIVDRWNTFDLSSYNLYFEEPVFISLEYIPKTKEENDSFRYSGQISGNSITRSSGLGPWNIKKGIKMSIYATVRQ